ncbi:hypothetical protein Pstu01_29140 [Stutzerimonas stutzeri]|nr:hypothetical protein Pstu01_29140 [Stutzerimonas stutzeri]
MRVRGTDDPASGDRSVKTLSKPISECPGVSDTKPAYRLYGGPVTRTKDRWAYGAIKLQRADWRQA